MYGVRTWCTNVVSSYSDLSQNQFAAPLTPELFQSEHLHTMYGCSIELDMDGTVAAHRMPAFVLAQQRQPQSILRLVSSTSSSSEAHCRHVRTPFYGCCSCYLVAFTLTRLHLLFSVISPSTTSRASFPKICRCLVEKIRSTPTKTPVSKSCA